MASEVEESSCKDDFTKHEGHSRERDLTRRKMEGKNPCWMRKTLLVFHTKKSNTDRGTTDLFSTVSFFSLFFPSWRREDPSSPSVNLAL